ncbi:MAG TPA: hypothetical protein VEB66_04325 [Opitutaceae bacterium]|nr:hypothetical protein [Opitutaceae bacterium]
MKPFLGIVALLAAAGLFYSGYSRGVSLAGRTQTSIAQLKTGVDGKTRVPDHHWHYGGAVALALVGGVLLRRRR